LVKILFFVVVVECEYKLNSG